MAITEKRRKTVLGVRVEFEHHRKAGVLGYPDADYWAGLVPCGRLNLSGFGGNAFDMVSADTFEDAVAKVGAFIKAKA